MNVAKHLSSRMTKIVLTIIVVSLFLYTLQSTIKQEESHREEVAQIFSKIDEETKPEKIMGTLDLSKLLEIGATKTWIASWEREFSKKADKASYKGTLMNGKPEGYGICTIHFGTYFAEYNGKWENGSPHGQGVLNTNMGLTYQGNWFVGQPWKEIKVTMPNGAVYFGDWSFGKPNGQGTLTYVDGTTYTGTFVHGIPHGRGTIKNNNGYIYVGEWIESEKQGQGKAIDAEGNRQEGRWSKNEFVEGMVYYANGRVVRLDADGTVVELEPKKK